MGKIDCGNLLLLLNERAVSLNFDGVLKTLTERKMMLFWVNF